MKKEKINEEKLKKGREILIKIIELAEEFNELSKELQKEKRYNEIHLIGSLIVGIYSPIISSENNIPLGVNLMAIGPRVMVKGLLEILKKEMEKERITLEEYFA